MCLLLKEVSLLVPILVIGEPGGRLPDSGRKLGESPRAVMPVQVSRSEALPEGSMCRVVGEPGREDTDARSEREEGNRESGEGCLVRVRVRGRERDRNGDQRRRSQKRRGGGGPGDRD
jgi:hypothetical protein